MKSAEEILKVVYEKAITENPDYADFDEADPFTKSTCIAAMEAYADQYRSLPSGVTEQQLAQLFDNNSDCFADTWRDGGADLNGKQLMIEGDVISAMTKQKFIEIISGFKASAPVSEWVSVEDGLPERCVNVLGATLLDGKYHLIASYIQQDNGAWYWADSFQRLRNTVTHWMPLPTPPTTK